MAEKYFFNKTEKEIQKIQTIFTASLMTIIFLFHTK